MNKQPGTGHYQVKLVECPSLSPDERAASELRFRMSLEFSLGGPDQVLPSLQAYLLVQSLNEDLPLGAQVSQAEEQVIALWENAEEDAILAAFRPLNRDMGDARFEIVPL
ncbi:MAG: hypothetical protein PSV40_06040 [Polaromonas sp.]|uniref:hypothetical protein n=1 Tax=Polaromonas sp. TaxID=1869339 RepID=UPI002488DF2F|nr:hypothetical protein [Polaromonas sp.]MDI1268648.1 hypothetical protein [Polaromonas sp.]